MAFRRCSFDVWPGFDEKLGRGAILSGGEEHYAFFALIERGYRVVYNPRAVVRHPDPSTAEEALRRHLNLLAITTAYITRLAVEHPSCRSPLARYLLDRLYGSTPPWMERHAKAAPRIAPRWLSSLVIFSGPWIYLRSRLARQIPGTPGHIGARNFAKNPSTPAILRDETCNLKS
jgi:hypothetical protein